MLNSQITLSCPFETPFYKWTRPDYPSHFLDETKNLTIKADSFGVSGRYQCSAVNGFGNSLAEMAIRVVDYNSPAIRRECALSRDGKINKAGPCFLKSYTDSELMLTRYSGEDVTFDCSSVTADGRTYQLNYAWEFHKQGLGEAHSSGSPASRLIRRSNQLGSSSMPSGGPPSNPLAPGSGGRNDLARFSESQLTIRKVTLGNSGEYRCTVTNPSPDPSAAVIPKIERSFQLHVIRK
ncbi:unnamed protein product [Mesocestoides corti]|uniref:Ig-like domain-containing protein n=1 Tax=Mesocestoides corti TaxID=53468 RepID=A0A0R3UAW4_MESCO|nr:unnamed protein product [Mesocestoides corti]